MSISHFVSDPDKPLKFRRDPGEKVKQILGAFSSLLEKQGYETISTNRIAKEAKVSIGTLYKYFPEGKPDILKKLFDETVDDFMDEQELIYVFQNILKGELRDIKYFVSRFLKSHRDSYQYHHAYDQAISSNKEFFKNFQGGIGDKIQQFVNMPNKPFDFGTLDIESLYVALFVALNVLESLTHHHMFYTPLFQIDGKPDDEAFVDYMAGVFQYTLQRYLKL